MSIEVLPLIDQGQPLHDCAGRENSTRSDAGVGSDLAAVPDQSSEFFNTCVDPLAPVHEQNSRISLFIAVIRDD